jgi:hypothetical protein
MERNFFRHHRRPSVEPLEGRTMLSGGVRFDTDVAVVAMRPSAVVRTMSFSPSPTPLGVIFTADLHLPPAGTYYPSSTEWTQTITYDGATTPPTVITSAGLLSATLVSAVPGTYDIEATTTYMTSNPTVAPPPPSTVTGTVTIPAPDTVTKGGGVGTPIPPGMAALMVDPVAAGGMPIGNLFLAPVQEDIPTFTWWNGTVAGTGGWVLDAPSVQFFFGESAIHDQFMIPPTTPADWAAIPIGTVLATVTQELRFCWTMSTDGGTNVPCVVNLPPLTWTLTKCDANDWEAN